MKIHGDWRHVATGCTALVFLLTVLTTVIFRPASQYYVRRCGLLLEMEYRGLSVGLTVTIVSGAKTAEPIEMPFGLWTRVGLRKHVLDKGSDSRCKGQF